MSAFGKTTYPYCKHLRYLDLRDLGDLLDDDKFRGKISKQFFAGVLAQYHYVLQTSTRGRVARLDIKKIVAAIGDKITQESPLLEALSEPTIGGSIFSDSLAQWTPRLTHLKSLEMYDGKVLADETLQNLIHTSCPGLNTLRIYSSTNEDADHALAAFISGMPPNTLVTFENISNCRIGPETCLALNHHGKSLESLKLGLTDDSVQHVALLQGCTELLTFAVASSQRAPDLKATQNDAYLEIVDWLRKCNRLKDISFFNFVSAPDLLLPVLLNQHVELENLQINATEAAMYVVKDHHEFHQALSQQPTLQSLLLRADPDASTRDDQDTIVEAFCSLKDLRKLSLIRISDYLSNEHLVRLADNLIMLEDVYVGGYGVDDNVLESLAKLPHLKSLTFSGITNFTETGILDFIENLSESNRGMLLSVDNADGDNAMSDASQNLIREVMMTKLDGRFEYQLFRGLYSDHIRLTSLADFYRPKCSRVW